MRKRVTTREVAKAAGVSASTVSRVLNNDPRITPATAAGVIRVARELGFCFTPKSGRRLIGVMTPGNVMNCHIMTVLHALINAIPAHGYRAEIISEGDWELLDDRVISGAIAIQGDDTLNERWARYKNVPLIRMGFPGNHLERIFTVTSDGIADMKNIVDHLSTFGHKKIGCITMHTRKFEEGLLLCRRMEGFIRAMASRGIFDAERYIAYEDDGSLAASLDRLVNRLGVTALITLSGSFTPKAFRALRNAGVRIPERLSLIGWEYPEVLSALTPACSALAPDMEGHAEEALKLLDRLIAGDPRATDVVVPGRLIPRQTVGAPFTGSAGRIDFGE